MGFLLLPWQQVHFGLHRMLYLSIFYVPLVNVRAQFDTQQYIPSQTKVTREDPRKSLHLREMPNALLWASRSDYFITCYYGWNFYSGCLSRRWKSVIPRSREIQQYPSTGRFTRGYLGLNLKICRSKRKACFSSASLCLCIAQIVPWPQECLTASAQIGFVTPGRVWVKAHSISALQLRNKPTGMELEGESERIMECQNGLS